MLKDNKLKEYLLLKRFNKLWSTVKKTLIVVFSLRLTASSSLLQEYIGRSAFLFQPFRPFPSRPGRPRLADAGPLAAVHRPALP
jgi:hypothetical protein